MGMLPRLHFAMRLVTLQPLHLAPVMDFAGYATTTTKGMVSRGTGMAMASRPRHLTCLLVLDLAVSDFSPLHCI